VEGIKRLTPGNEDNQKANRPDAAAQVAEALKLLRARDFARHRARVSEMLDTASRAGSAQATELCALFDAMGIARPQSWDRAFDRLELAARQGSISAQQQLLLLACPSAELTFPDPVPDWADVRRSISLNELLTTRPRTVVSDVPRIRIIEQFATPAECRWLIDCAQSRTSPALIVDSTGRQVTDPVRTNRGAQFLLHDMDVVLEVIRTRISLALRIPLHFFEPTQVLHYAVGEEFKIHHDYFDPNDVDRQREVGHGQRIATCLIYLNSDFEGGETEFPSIDLRYRGEVGDAIFWANVEVDGQPDRKTLHAGLPPTAGEKWVLSQWVRDRTPEPA